MFECFNFQKYQIAQNVQVGTATVNSRSTDLHILCNLVLLKIKTFPEWKIFIRF